jgi:hypothetical protein
VVMVAVETRERVTVASGVRGIEKAAPLEDLIGRAHLAGHRHGVKGASRMAA